MLSRYICVEYPQAASQGRCSYYHNEEPSAYCMLFPVSAVIKIMNLQRALTPSKWYKAVMENHQHAAM